MQISAQLASLSITNSLVNSTASKFSPAPFSAPRSFVRINTLWSCSLTISLITASIGILVKQWFHEFMAQDTQDPQFRIRIRFFRSEGLDKWQVFQIAAALPLLLQIALLLFFIGLSEYLRELNPIVGWATTGTILAWLAVFVFTTLAPILSSQCPYRTPILKQFLQYLRSTTQSAYGFVKQYVIGSICLSTTSLLVLGKRILLSRVRPRRETVREGWIWIELGDQLETYLEWLVADGDLSKLLFRVIFTAPISLPLLLTGISLSAYMTMKDMIMEKVVRRQWLDTSTWRYIPPPEESTVRKEQMNDWDLLLYSGPFFLDQQLPQTVRECTLPISVGDIASGSVVTTQTYPGWRFHPGLCAKQKAKELVRDIVLYRAMATPEDSTWFAAFGSILGEGSRSPCWDDHPTLVIRLTRSNSGLKHGATDAFLALYSMLTRGKISIGGIGGIFHRCQSKGDKQCM